MQEAHGAQAGVVEGAIENEAQEVSSPAREGEEVERTAADELNAASTKSAREFRGKLAESAETRRDAQEYLGGIAEENEIHQEAAKDEVATSEQSLLDSIRELTTDD